MRTKGKLSYIRLLVPVLLFAGVQMFAQGAADSRTAATGPASHKLLAMASPQADMPLISDRIFVMKSIAGITDESMKPGCSSSFFSLGVRQSQFSGRCPIVDCAAPPPGCFYQGPPATGPNGCPINCGTLVCDPNGIN